MTKPQKTVSFIFAYLQIQLNIHTDPTMAAQYLKEDTKPTSAILQCHPIHLGIYTDPSIGTHTFVCLQYSSKQANCRLIGKWNWMLQPYIDSVPHSLIRWSKRFSLTFYALLTMHASEQDKVRSARCPYIYVCVNNLVK